jgi:hypothetical protein
MAMAKEFDELALDGHNYPTWASDIKINFASRGLLAHINEPIEGVVLDEQKKYGALMLLRFYIHKDLKQEYLMEENPRTLWLALKERYDQQKELIWPEANHEWNHLRLQDFKSVADYNHAVHKICSKLKFCEKEPTDADKIEKTLSTMLPADRVLQQQYRASNYTVYSQLIHTLTQAEKHDELLMKNHHKRPVGATPLPEVHNVQNNVKNKKFKGSTSGGPKNKPEKRKFNKKQKPNGKNKQKGEGKSKNDNKCHRCGTYSHFAKDCRTPKHLVALYQKSLKEAKQGKAKEPGIEAHFNLASEATKEVGCSSKTIVEAKNNNAHQIENLPGRDDMIMEFTSNDMFGDFN